MGLVQFELSNGERRVGVVEGGQVREVQSARTVRDLALAAIEAGLTLRQQIERLGLAASLTTPNCWPSKEFCPAGSPGPGAYVGQRYRPDPSGQCIGAGQDAPAGG